eukprot:TRINITY_DN7251_c0_g1_i1.p1 TRINITY_DN7251_c0_g1~~TRINITY_DN7251_c0_g1_i1.p1  ORF type:complete len:291 (-),score=75.66 TRINITY_DN7251_c0_g1_i1:2-811(-)
MYAPRKKKSFFSTPFGIASIVIGIVLLFVIVRYAAGPSAGASVTGAMGIAGEECVEGCPCNNGPIHVISWEPRVFLYKGFVSEEEADYLVSKAKPLLEPSRVVGKDGDILSDVRTSSGTFMETNADPIMMAIEERIAKWSMIPKEHGESFYVLEYQLGQQYKAHHDYFEGEAAPRYIGNSGQRTATVLTYLSTPEEGGETVFPLAGITVRPDKGDAVLFHSHLPNGELDPMSLHGGNPVIRGIKYCMTKWIRVQEYEWSWYKRQENAGA